MILLDLLRALWLWIQYGTESDAPQHPEWYQDRA